MYSIVIPVYNSDQTLVELTERISSLFDKLDQKFEIVFVEDRGNDNSWGVIKLLKEKYTDNIQAVRLNRNYGQHNALLCGFTYAKGDIIITIDDDLQNPPEEIEKLIERYKETNSDIIYGIYTKKQHNFARNALSSGVKKTSQVLMKRSGNGSSFRLVKKCIVKKIIDHNISFIFIDEVMQWYTDSIDFVTVEHHKRKYNSSGYSAFKLLSLGANLAYHYTNIPLKIMVYGGMVISFLTFLLGLKFVIQKIYYDVPLGYTSMIVTILFSTSIIVFSLGVIGGYLSRIQTVQNKKPPYFVDEVLE